MFIHSLKTDEKHKKMLEILSKTQIDNVRLQDMVRTYVYAF